MGVLPYPVAVLFASHTRPIQRRSAYPDELCMGDLGKEVPPLFKDHRMFAPEIALDVQPES